MSILVDFRRTALLAKSRILLAKGEATGHPFRGNQYRAGVHGGSMSGPVSDRPYHKPLVASEPTIDADWSMTKVHEKRSIGDIGNKAAVSTRIAMDLAKDPAIQPHLEAYSKEFTAKLLQEHLLHNVQQVINHAPDVERENFAKALGITVADLDAARARRPNAELPLVSAVENAGKLSHDIALKLANKVIDDPEFVAKYTDPTRSSAGHWEYYPVEGKESLWVDGKERTWIDDPRPPDHIGIDAYGLKMSIEGASASVSSHTHGQIDESLITDSIIGTYKEADRWSVVGAHVMAQDVLDNWAATSSDASGKSLAMQMAIAKHFDLGEDHVIFGDTKTEGWYDPDRKKDAVAKAKSELDKYGDVYDGAVRSIYNRTQEILKEDGVESAVLFRGTTDKEAADYGVDKSVKLSPIGSWSYMKDQGTSFAGMRAPDKENQRLLIATVPRERIFSTFVTGPGCTNEQEVVVLGGKGIDKITVMRRTNADDENPKGKLWTAEKPPLYSPAQKTDRKLESWYGVDGSPGQTIPNVESKHQAALVMIAHGDMNLKEYTGWFNHVMPGVMESSKWKQGIYDQAKQTAHSYQDGVAAAKPSYDSQSFKLGHATAKDVEAMITLPHADGKTPKTISEKHKQALSLIDQGKLTAAEHSSWIDDHGAQEGLTPSQVDSYKLAAWLSESTKSEGLEAG